MTLFYYARFCFNRHFDRWIMVNIGYNQFNIHNMGWEVIVYSVFILINTNAELVIIDNELDKLLKNYKTQFYICFYDFFYSLCYYKPKLQLCSKIRLAEIQKLLEFFRQYKSFFRLYCYIIWVHYYVVSKNCTN